ncbi:hypothetical protein ACFY0N_00790 [Streptomyces vinaceus]|uniref:hypothetical protein n=1 Tax=Streptomyces vinaceus TaxID=1960 RepID=UPI0036BCE8FD
MSRTRPVVTEALEGAGWTGDGNDPLDRLRHPSGAVWGLISGIGACSLDCPDGGGVDFTSSTSDQVIIAACLAAAGQLTPAVDVVCDHEGHAVPHSRTCPQQTS